MSDVRVLIVDDQALVREGIATILDAEPDITIVGEAATGLEAVAEASTLRPDVICMDVQMPDMDGLEATRLVVADPTIRAGVLILTTFQREDYLVAALRAGAAAVMVGTALLLADEAGTSAVHRAAIAGRPGPTVITRAFTGRPARGLVSEFIVQFEPRAPLGYPALHHLTSPLRKAAAAAGDPEWVHLWAGTGHGAVTPGPVADILRRLAV